MILRFKVLLGMIVLLGLSACGGGGGGLERPDGPTNNNGGGTTDDTPITFSVAMELTSKQTGEVSKILSEDNELLLTAVLTNSKGETVNNELIKFSFEEPGFALFSNNSASAPTDSNGVATIGLSVGPGSGGVKVLASIDGAEPIGEIVFSSEGQTQINATPSTLQLFSSTTQLPSSGSDEIELIAIVKDENNVLLENINVTFSANAGANIQLPDSGSVSVTGEDGIARALLNTLNQPENRIISVVASAEGLAETQTLDIQVVGTQVNIDGATSLIINDPAPITISVVDSDGKGIANQLVTISSENGTLSESSTMTSASGQVTVEYTASNAGSDTITASSLNANSNFTLTVQEDNFAFTTLPQQAVELGDDAQLSITWLKDNAPFASGAVNLTSSRGSVLVSDATTDVDGVANFTIQSSNAGFASVSATGLDTDGNQVTARTEIEFIATEADSIIVDGTPDSVGPSGQTATVTAVVRDPNGNLVKGKVINFVVDDVSGGTISPNQATTDGSGIASTVYTSNAVSSFEAVKVYATVAEEPSVSNFTLLTVDNRPFDLSIGTGRLMEAPEQSSYAKEFSIFVTTPSSNPVENALVTLSATPIPFNKGGVYRKGFWVWNETDEIWESFTTATCANEDINGNGILDDGEDINGDGFLTPGNIGPVPSTRTSDENGQILIDFLYPKEFGRWAEVEIIVKAESAGSESKDSKDFALGVLVDDLKVEGSPPPSSPWGSSASCTDTD